jgi:glutaredoxin-like protein NrdH
MVVEQVPGKDRGQVMLYALSTCQWCKKTKDLLKELGIAFSFQYVDLLDGGEQNAVMDELEKWNPHGSFPTLVINSKSCIVGFREDEIRKAFGA